jgi:hypothetical protein
MADEETTEEIEEVEVAEISKVPWRKKETPVVKETPAVKPSGNVIVKYVRGGSYAIEGHYYDQKNPYESVTRHFANILIATGAFVEATESEYQTHNRNKK